MVEFDDGEIPREKAKVFLSYSRKDRERAQSIADVLRERHFGVFKDTDDILPTEEWKGRLEQLISEADTIVFLLSPHSIASEVCAWEVEYAKSLKKRIAPIVITEVDTGQIPADLARLNFIFCTERDRFQDAIDNLISALNTDIDWVREHTRLSVLAERWSKANQPSHLLLRGQDIHDAEQWRDTRPDDAPHITLQQSRFIANSRSSAIRRQRVVTISSVVGFGFALSLAVFAYLQREAAIESEQLAQQQRNEAQTNQSLLLTGFAEEATSNWGPVEGVLLSLEALPDQRSISPSRRDRPLVDEAQLMLRNSRRNLSEEAVLLSGLADSKFSLSKDQRWVAVHSPSTSSVYLVDVNNEHEPQRITETAISGPPIELSFSQDNSLLAIPDGNGGLRIQSTEAGLAPYTMQVTTSALSVAEFINNDREVLTRDYDSILRVIEIESGRVTFEQRADLAVVSPDGNRFGLLDDGIITVYDSRDKSAISSSEATLSASVQQITQLAFSNDNKWLAGATEQLTVIFDSATMAVYGNTPVQDMSILSFGFGPEDKWHYVSGANGKTDLYDIENGVLVGSHAGHNGWVFDVAIAADRTAVLTSSNTGWMQLWSPATGETSAFLGGHTDVVTQVNFLESANKAISLSTDGTLRLWDLNKWINPKNSTGDETLIDGYAGDAVYNRDRSLIALSETGIFQLETGENIPVDGLDPRYTRFVKFDESGLRLLTLIESDIALEPVDACLVDTASNSIERCFVSRNEGNVQSFDIDKRAQTVVISEIVESDNDKVDRHFVTLDPVTGDEIGRIVTAPGDRLGPPILSPDGEAVFSLSQEQELRKYDRTLTKILSTFGPDEGGVEIIFSPDKDRVLFYWAVQDVAEIWDTSTGRPILAFDFTVAYSGAEIVFSPEGNFLVSVTDSETLTVYDTNTGEQFMQLAFASETSLEKPVFSLDERLVAAHAGQKVIVWDLAKKRKVSDFEVDFRGFAPLTFGKAFVDGGNAIVAWSWDGPVKFPIIIDPQTVISLAQQQVPRCLSISQRKRYFLSPEPPRWCITGPGLENENDSKKWNPKFPYTNPQWREWLIANDNGETLPLPE